MSTFTSQATILLNNFGSDWKADGDRDDRLGKTDLGIAVMGVAIETRRKRVCVAAVQPTAHRLQLYVLCGLRSAQAA